MKNKTLLIIFFLSLFSATLLNTLNVNAIKSQNPENKQLNAKSLVHNETIWSIDNEWYLPQFRNFQNGNGFTLDTSEPEMKVRRTPIYPLFYGILSSIFGEKKGYVATKYLQLILFSISAVLITLTVYNFSNEDHLWALTTGVVYAILPFIPSYLYFTITEGLSPTLVVLVLYFYSLYYKNKKSYLLILVAFGLALAFLTRPLTGVILPGILIGLFVLNRSTVDRKIDRTTFLKNSLTLTFFFLIFLSPWIIRNYQVTGELIVAEKIYHKSPMDKGRAHVELRFLISCWTNPTNLSADVFSSKLRANISNGNIADNQKVIEQFIDQWPEKAFRGYTRNDLKRALQKLELCFINKHNFRKNNEFALRKSYLNLPCEENTYKDLNDLRMAYKDETPVDYYVLTPLSTLKETIFNSALHNLVLINPIDKQNNSTHLILKSIAYILNVLVFMSLVFFMFSKNDFNLKAVLFIPVFVLSIALTVMLFRYVEVRYFLPLYPLLYISFGYFVSKIMDKTNFL